VSVRNKADSDFSFTIIKVLKSERVDEKNRVDFRVVKWKLAGKPVLEKRRIWEREDGDQPGKIIGLDSNDLRWIYDNYPDIINLL